MHNPYRVISAPRMTALGAKRPFADLPKSDKCRHNRMFTVLFDHLVATGKQRCRNDKA